MKNNNLLKPQDAASLIGVSPNTFQLMIAKGQVPAPIMVGMRKFWNKSILKAWSEAGFQTAGQLKLMKQWNKA